MWKRITTSIVDNDNQNNNILIDQKTLNKNDSVFTLCHQKNNHDLMSQVQHLIRQNQNLKNQIDNNIIQKSKSVSFLNKSTFYNHPYEKNFQNYNNYKNNHYTNYKNTHINHFHHNDNDNITEQLTAKKHIPSNQKQKQNIHLYNHLYHPRNVYLTPEEAMSINFRKNQKMKNHQNMDLQKGYENLKQRLSNHNNYQLKNQSEIQDNRTNNKRGREIQNQRKNNQNNIKNTAYFKQKKFQNIQSYKLQENQIQPFVQYHRHSYQNQSKHNKQTNYKTYLQRKQTPIAIIQRDQNCFSPPQRSYVSHRTRTKTETNNTQSNVKVEDIYPENNVRIQAPRTRWNQVTDDEGFKSRVDRRSSIVQNNNVNLPISRTPERQSSQYNYYGSTQKRRKKRYLSVISGMFDGIKESSKKNFKSFN